MVSWSNLKLHPKDDKYSEHGNSSPAHSSNTLNEDNNTISLHKVSSHYSNKSNPPAQKSMQFVKLEDEEEEEEGEEKSERIAPTAMASDACFDYDLLYHKYDNPFPLKRYQTKLCPTFHQTTVNSVLIFTPRTSFNESDGSNSTHPNAALKNPLVITAGKDNKAYVWDLYTQRKISVFEGHSKEILTTVYHPLSDRIITGGADNKICIWDYHNPKIQSRCLNEDSAVHAKPISSIAMFDPSAPPAATLLKNTPTAAAIQVDPTVLICSSFDKDFSIWDYYRGECLRKIKSGHTDLILSIAAVNMPTERHPCGLNAMRIITASWDKTIRYFSYHSIEKPPTIMKEHKKSVVAIVAHKAQLNHHHCHLLLSASLDKSVIIWDLESKKKIRALVGHKEKITCLRVYDRIDDGLPPIVITGSEDSTTIMWDMLSGVQLRVLQHAGKVTALDVYTHPIWGNIIVTADSTIDTKYHTLSVWNLCRTERIRKFKTKAVTAIETYIPRIGEDRIKENLVTIGAVNGKCNVFQLHSGNFVGQFSQHTTRINAAVIYKSPDITQHPLMITCDGVADIKVWDLVTFEELRVLRGHDVVVMTLALYDPEQSNKSNEVTEVHEPSHSDVLDLSKPMIISGGIDQTILIWDFLSDGPPLKKISKAHTNTIRSIAMCYPSTLTDPVRFVTGSYDKTAKVWDLATGKELQIMHKIHTDWIFTIVTYDPINHLQDHIKRVAEDYRDPLVIQASYDGLASIWNMKTGKCLQCLQGHKDSVTALACYTPRSTTDDPLVITGSVDKMVIVWNLFTGQRIQTLVGHSDRVCYIHIFYPPPTPGGGHANTPLLITGGDDNLVIVWEDSLYQQPTMPLRDAVNRCFEADLCEEDWPMITEMTLTYGFQVFVENSNLFYLAIKNKRPDFILKFLSYLTYVLCHIKEFDDQNLLTYAIHQRDLISVRAILLSWTENLNQDVSDMLIQKVYHPCYLFRTEDLKILGLLYPVEFVYFITGLKLIRNHESLLGLRYNAQILDAYERYEVNATNNPAAPYKQIWRPVLERKGSYVTLMKWLDQLIFKQSTVKQSVTSLMIPLASCASIDVLTLFVEVSNLLDNVDIFNCEIGVIALRYFWAQHGMKNHVKAMVRYFMALGIFMVCLYSYQFQYKRNSSQSADNAILFLNIFVICIFFYYFVEEIRQCFAKHREMLHRIQRKEEVFHPFGNIMRTFTRNDREEKELLVEEPQGDDVIIDAFRKSLQGFLFTHFILDLWNAFDMVIIITGIAGLVLRISLSYDSPTGRCFLAVTSVLMWFKVLYFMRPFSSSGPLVAMILQITYDIRFFILVLFCVLAGFAQAFWLLSNLDENLSFGTVSKSLLTSFFFMLGQNVEADFGGTVAPSFATVLLVIFMMVMMILMLNILIALMGDTFAVVRAKGLALWRKEQANIMFDQVFELFDSQKIHPYLHVLKYTSDIGIDYTDNKLITVVEASKVHVTKFTELPDLHGTGSSLPNTSKSNKGSDEKMFICDVCTNYFIGKRKDDHGSNSKDPNNPNNPNNGNEINQGGDLSKLIIPTPYGNSHTTRASHHASFFGSYAVLPTPNNKK